MIRWLVAALLVAGCSSENKQPAPVAEPPQNEAEKPREVPADPEPVKPKAEAPPPQPVGQGEAALVFTGAIEKELSGKIVTCGYTHLDGKDQGGTWQIPSDEFSFQISVHSDEDWDEPSVIMNVTKPERKSYVLKAGGKVTAKPDRTVAEIDADLKKVVGSETVHVKGTMTCPPR